jgi:DNA repair exonuclease SbcCD ATPase subunit
MAKPAPKETGEREKGFGTGLRAQLEEKRGKKEAAAEEASLAAAQPPAGAASAAEPARPKLEVAPPLPPLDLSYDANFEALRAELTAALAREQDLRTTLEEQVEAYERGLNADRDFALREAELEGRIARANASEQAFVDRERTIAKKFETLEAEERRFAALKSELTTRQARLEEREQQAEAKLRELTDAERERAKAGADVSKQAAAIADREKKLGKSEAQLAEREREAADRLASRERALSER